MYLRFDSTPNNPHVTDDIEQAKIFRSRAYAEQCNHNPGWYEVVVHYIPIYKEHAGSPMIGTTFPK